MVTRNIGIVIDGATGRLGTTQHLRSLMAIRAVPSMPRARPVVRAHQPRIARDIGRQDRSPVVAQLGWGGRALSN